MGVIRTYSITPVSAPMSTRGAIRPAPIWRGPRAGRRCDAWIRAEEVAWEFAAGRARQGLRTCVGACGFSGWPTRLGSIAGASPRLGLTNPSTRGESFRSRACIRRSLSGCAEAISGSPARGAREIRPGFWRRCGPDRGSGSDSHPQSRSPPVVAAASTLQSDVQ